MLSGARLWRALKVGKIVIWTDREPLQLLEDHADVYVHRTDSVYLLVLITKEHVLSKTVSTISTESISHLIGRLQSLQSHSSS